MEVTIDSDVNLPKDNVVSIRIGGTRRQAPVSALGLHKLKFPKMNEIAEPMKIDILQPIFRGSFVLVPGQEDYKIEFKTSESKVESVHINVKNDVPPEQQNTTALMSSPEKPPELDQSSKPNQYSEAVKSAQGYLEDKKLLQYFQGLLHDTIKEKPTDPIRHIWQLIGKGLPEDAKRGLDQPLASSKEVEDLKELEDARRSQMSDEDRQRLEKGIADLNEAEVLREKLAQKLSDLEAKCELSLKASGQQATQGLVQSPEVNAQPRDEETQKLLQEKIRELEEAEKQRKELQTEVTDLASKVKQNVQAEEDDKKKVAQLATELDEAERLRKEMAKTVAWLTEKVKQYMPVDEQETLSQSIEEVKNSTEEDARLTELHQSMDEAEEHRKKLEAAVTELEGKVERLTAEKNKKNEVAIDSPGVQPGDKANLEEIVAEKESEIAELKAKLETAEKMQMKDTDRERLEKGIEDLKKAEELREALEKRVSDLTAKAKSMMAESAPPNASVPAGPLPGVSPPAPPLSSPAAPSPPGVSPAAPPLSSPAAPLPPGVSPPAPPLSSPAATLPPGVYPPAVPISLSAAPLPPGAPPALPVAAQQATASGQESLVERRVDPMLGNRAVTYQEMSLGLAAEKLSEEQLREHWNNLHPVQALPEDLSRKLDEKVAQLDQAEKLRENLEKTVKELAEKVQQLFASNIGGVANPKAVGATEVEEKNAAQSSPAPPAPPAAEQSKPPQAAPKPPQAPAPPTPPTAPPKSLQEMQQAGLALPPPAPPPSKVQEAGLGLPTPPPS